MLIMKAYAQPKSGGGGGGKGRNASDDERRYSESAAYQATLAGVRNPRAYVNNNARQPFTQNGASRARVLGQLNRR